ncbi:MAG TPA: glycosyltransferase family 2 protein [Beijerinckiaceae bacterium]|nr:glycosyltransferase family 2 protein [Beijerinckiaceae bacterium]
MDIVSVVIPTLNRQPSLKRALASLMQQRLDEQTAMDIIVVDNSVDANARFLVEAMAEDGAPLRYFSEPVPGVATARNAGVAAATGRWVAFLDDDEQARPDWLARLVEVARSTGADAVFGPVLARSDGVHEIGGFAPYFCRRIDRADRADITDLAAYLGTNNSMFDRARCLAGAGTFETSLNETGGEDSLLLKRLVLTGRRFAWAAEAEVLEWAAEKRLNWAYVRKRKFLSGQIRVFVHHMVQPVEWGGIAKWMAVGGIQAVGAGLLAVALWPFARARAERAAATAWGGLGKVFWASRFRPSMYGSGLVS